MPLTELRTSYNFSAAFPADIPRTSRVDCLAPQRRERCRTIERAGRILRRTLRAFVRVLPFGVTAIAADRGVPDAQGFGGRGKFESVVDLRV